MSTLNFPFPEHTPLDYSQLTPAQMRAYLEQQVTEHELAIERIIENQSELPSWDDLVLAVDDLDASLLGTRYVIVPLLYQSEEWSAVIIDGYERVDSRLKHKLKDARLYQLYLRLFDSAIGRHLDAHQRVTLELILRDFRLAGVLLDEAAKAQLEEIEAQIRTLELSYSDNIARSVSESTLSVPDLASLDGLAPWQLSQLQEMAPAPSSTDGLQLTCDGLTYRFILRHVHDRSLREQMYRLYQTRGSHPQPSLDNGVVLQQLAELREDKARLLGFDNYVQLGMQGKSAGSVEHVQAFLGDLATRIGPVMRVQQEQLQRLAAEHGLEQVQPWDIDYLLASQVQQRSGLSEEQIRDHFPLPTVVQALIDLAQQLFGVTLQRWSEAPAWHPSVLTYEVIKDHASLGYLYLDLLQHPAKQPEAVYTAYLWNRRVDAEGRYHGAVAAVMCDIAPGPDGAQPLLDHEALRKLFHEFGHALHHLLVRTGNHLLSDLMRLGSDGVEVSGKLLERWAWDADYLASISAHHELGHSLTAAELQGWLDAGKNDSIRECAKILGDALFDLDLHLSPRDGRTLEQRVLDNHARAARWPLAGFERPMHAFDYLVTGYDAGYYAYLWSDVYAFDLFSRFEQAGLLDQHTGLALLEALFAPGISRPLKASFEAFMGRPVSAEPYLQWHGLA
ncbi:oligopeptidase A [Pseudomonas hunanensis]|uniref:Oligopeptidase A n=1 Tax=Pseudomonas hunanensis TaxID=1247546 RepID=A0ACC6JX34_9PSED|nr:M3 family metallopeptidase [Pseudomonas hunanensis]MDR6710754.1 oligopeptidase A [Pseudomonas hunanensis]